VFGVLHKNARGIFLEKYEGEVGLLYWPMCNVCVAKGDTHDGGRLKKRTIESRQTGCIVCSSECSGFFVLKTKLCTHFENKRITARMIVWKTNIIFTLEMHSVSVSFRSEFSRERILNIFIDE